jgi:hypothetical protein
MKYIREAHRPKMLEGRVLRKIFGSERGLVKAS